ncbi:MAG: hypothetical protein HY827_07080 [Actinobacteria bacterium]|nr:hypothetical protein [Actinomycetota bacterium]
MSLLSVSQIRTWFVIATAGTVMALALTFTPTAGATAGGPSQTAAARGAVCDVNVNPKHAARIVGTTHTIKATVLGRDNSRRGGKRCILPLSGVTVEVRGIFGPGAGVTTSLITDGNGQASYSFSSAVTGNDITRFTADGQRGSATTFWIDGSGGQGPYSERPKGIGFVSAGAHSIAMYVPTACRRGTLNLDPVFNGGSPLVARMQIDNVRIPATTKNSLTYNVNVRRFRPGSHHQISLTAVFTSGVQVELKSTFKVCRR